MAEADGFMQAAGPFRPELLAHCYRMLGSLDDAEDLVHETYLLAGKGQAGFEDRSSLRTRLYRIATSACLTALEHRSRRFLPSGLGAPGDHVAAPDGTPREVAWITPLPGAALEPAGADPASVVAARAGVRLPLVAALQHLPPRQRAVLLLRGVLGWRAAEVADLLGMSTAAVDGALQRAQAQLGDVAPGEEDAGGPLDPARQAFLDRCVPAFEALDADALVRELRDDVTLELPPEAGWFRGRDAVAEVVRRRILPAGGPPRVVRTWANGSPALAVYRSTRVTAEPADPAPAHAVLVLDIAADGVAAITVFRGAGLFAAFGLAPVLGAGAHAGTDVRTGTVPARRR